MGLRGNEEGVGCTDVGLRSRSDRYFGVSCVKCNTRDSGHRLDFRKEPPDVNGATVLRSRPT